MKTKPTKELARVVNQLEGMIGSAATDRSIAKRDLRRILNFLAKVVQVVEQAFQDVFAVLLEIKYLTNEDVKAGRSRDLAMQLDMLLARSRYRDAEEICSRLFHLREQYEQQVAPLLGELGKNERWQAVFILIEEREGRIISLVHQTVFDLKEKVDKVTTRKVKQLNSYAGQVAEEIRLLLSELRSITNQLMGLSGYSGFLELTNDREMLLKQAQILINERTIRMSQDSYTAGQAGAMGPGSHAHDITFQQVWNQISGKVSLPQLAEELPKLRNAMKEAAKTAEDDLATGEIAAAEVAAQKGDGPAAIRHLKAAGKWAFDTATKIGTTVAAAAIKASLGI